jgi:DNA-binding winged helix-turn-helix (wHTH) protein
VVYRFGRFSLSRETRQLLAGADEVHLSPKAFELLLLLVEQRSRAMTKAELQELLWPSTFVGETNLATLVAEIRRALDDTAHASEIVRTVHRFGYRFVATITEAPAPSIDGRGHMSLAAGDRRFPLTEGVCVIGRAPESAIQIDAAGVSRQHARITVRDRQARIEDLGSKNGTFVGGDPVTAPRPLRDGDEIRIGPVALTFKIYSPTAPTETMPSRLHPRERTPADG